MPEDNYILPEQLDFWCEGQKSPEEQLDTHLKVPKIYHSGK